MKSTSIKPLISTIKDKCRTCYTCVRECPAKAIKISEGQAEIIPERCIGCGNCVLVCSQNAKKVHSSIPHVNSVIRSKYKTVALVAPSFAAEFNEYNYRKFVGMIKALGFDYVHEVGFGAELVAIKMKEIVETTGHDGYITTTCPAVFGYVKRYHPNLVSRLAPVVSPMIATARVVKQLYGDAIKIIFLGPCIAKKGEVYSEELDGEMDDALTFGELRTMFIMAHLDFRNVEESDFDPPFAKKGNLFPVRRGMLAAADIDEDLMTGEVVSANGKKHFIEAVEEFELGTLDCKLLDLLCCDGCIMGAGMTTRAPLYKRRTQISKYVKSTAPKRDEEEHHHYLDQFKDLDLSRTFYHCTQSLTTPKTGEVEEILHRMGKYNINDELNCGACGYDTCRAHAEAIMNGLAESEMCLPYVIEKMKKTLRELKISDEKLDDTRNALMQAEKLASMGQMAAGIAHEVNNPLGAVVMFSNLLKEQVDPGSEMYEDLDLIVTEANRCKTIVSGLLNFARKNKVNFKQVDMIEMVEKLLKTMNIPGNIKVTVNDEMGEDRNAEIDHDQIIQVLTNLLNNSVHAMPEGGSIIIHCAGTSQDVILKIEDTGTGIPQKNLSRIFEPFFTTKKEGQGTGLGLSVIYGIIKMHKGDISVQSNTDPEKGPTGSTFKIRLPKKSMKKLKSL
ncbi:MAG: 4Fe-4S binding protein [Candidatus Marinimicrobia bacterium]|nr:4Fe-4S binding protein [Candidatus Neomarinimicrobiota bacterium]